MKLPVTRAQAVRAADKYASQALNRAIDGMVGLIDKAIELRRAKPLRFALYHKYMGAWRKAQGYSGRFHERWYQHYMAKAKALKMEALAEKCGLQCVG